MKAKLQTMLALPVVTAAALLIGSVGTARADGMPARAAPAAYQPVQWSGIYMGAEGFVDWQNVSGNFPPGFGLHYNSHRDAEVNFGLFIGVQRQIGDWVIGVEANFIGTEFDTTNDRGENPAPGRIGNCPAAPVGNVPAGSIGNAAAITSLAGSNCSGRITDVITVGPRLGYARDRWMVYATGGYAFGQTNFRAISGGATFPPSGIAYEWADFQHDGWFVGGGLDWKLSNYAVVGIEYRHIDLGDDTQRLFNPATNVADGFLRQRADADMVLLRASLLFNPLPAVAAPLK